MSFLENYTMDIPHFLFHFRGKTIQSNVHCDSPDLNEHPNFAGARCEHTILQPGEMLFIPAFYWHQVSALDTGISLNMFYGDGGVNDYVAKILREPYRPHFEYWLLNVIEQNRSCDSFARMLPRLPEVMWQFMMKQWHERANEDQVQECVDMVMKHLGLEKLPPRSLEDQSKFPPVLKIRGLLFRDDTKEEKTKTKESD